MLVLVGIIKKKKKAIKISITLLGNGKTKMNKVNEIQKVEATQAMRPQHKTSLVGDNYTHSKRTMATAVK